MKPLRKVAFANQKYSNEDRIQTRRRRTENVRLQNKKVKLEDSKNLKKLNLQMQKKKVLRKRYGDLT